MVFVPRSLPAVPGTCANGGDSCCSSSKKCEAGNKATFSSSAQRRDVSICLTSHLLRLVNATFALLGRYVTQRRLVVTDV